MLFIHPDGRSGGRERRCDLGDGDHHGDEGTSSGCIHNARACEQQVYDAIALMANYQPR